MDKIKHLLGLKIRELRTKQGLSQQQLAEIINIDQRNLSNIECGNTFPAKSLHALSKALKISLSDLFDFDYLKDSSSDMKQYIKDELEQLRPDEIKIIYRMIKSMR